MTERVLGAPIEAVPLYAVLAVLHEWTAGKPANTCLGSSMLIVEALRYLGFDAEILAAYVEVYPLNDTNRAPLERLGRPDGTAVAHGDGSRIDGHVLVWAESFKRMVDAAVIQIPLLRAAADHDDIQLLPVIAPMESRQQLLANRPALQRAPYMVVYRVFSGGLDRLALARSGEYRQVFAYGGLQLAHTTLKLLQAAGEHRDLRAMHQLYPALRDLLAARRHLPPMPDEPPAMQRLRDQYPQFQWD